MQADLSSDALELGDTQDMLKKCSSSGVAQEMLSTLSGDVPKVDKQIGRNSCVEMDEIRTSRNRRN